MTALAWLTFFSAHSMLSPAIETNAFHHLYEINKQWEKHPELAPIDKVSFQTDNERIRFHLLSVIGILKSKVRNQHTLSQTINRNRLLDVLVGYADRMNFPVNKYHTQRQPYFIDENDNFCAVGFMLKASGYESVAREIQRAQNYDYVAEIKHPELFDWAWQHGFSLEELAWIQPSYWVQNTFQTLGTGTNGTVKDMTTHVNTLYFIGDFDELDGEPCAGIGKYQSGTVECVLDGLHGSLNHIFTIVGTVWVAGAIEHDGSTYPFASYENNTWTYHRVNNDESITEGLFVFDFYQSKYFVVRDNGGSQIWFANSNGTQWNLHASTNGIIAGVAYSQQKLFWGGEFDEITIASGIQTGQTYTTNNLASCYIMGDDFPDSIEWFNHMDNLPSKINVLASFGSVLYVGGENDGENQVLLTRYLNGVFQPLIQFPDADTVIRSINSIDILETGKLLIGAHLTVGNSTATYTGRNLFEFNVTANSYNPLGNFNSPVMCAEILGNDVFVGGDFTQNSNVAVNRLAKSSSLVSINEIDYSVSLSLYPNPASDYLQVDFNEPQNGELRVTDISGRVLLSESLMGKNRITLNVSHLASQVAFVSVVDNGKTVKTERLVIQ